MILLSTNITHYLLFKVMSFFLSYILLLFSNLYTTIEIAIVANKERKDKIILTISIHILPPILDNFQILLSYY